MTSVQEYIPLGKVRDFLESSGVYEILCLKTNRVYIGQSKAIAYRMSQHYGDLRANRHSNKALQKDWNEVADPDVFVFRVVTHLDPRDERLLFKSESKEIERMRRHGVILYNDLKVGVVVQDAQKTNGESKKQSNGKHDYGNSPYVRKSYSFEIGSNSATCNDCGMVGYVGVNLYKHDGDLRCERCVDKHSKRLEEKLRKERERVARNNDITLRVTSRFKMRWQLGVGSIKNNILMATARYVSKYGQFPTEAHFSLGFELPDVDDLKVINNQYTPPGFIDFPIPDVK